MKWNRFVSKITIMGLVIGCCFGLLACAPSASAEHVQAEAGVGVEAQAADTDAAHADDDLAREDLKTVLCYGDSNTFGYIPGSDGERYPMEDRWTTILGEELGDSYTVIPEGLCGRTTASELDGYEYINGMTYLKPCLITHMPVDVMVIMLGTNDCKIVQGVTAQEIADGLDALITQTEEVTMQQQKFVPEIIVVTPGAICEDLSNSKYAGTFDADGIECSRQIAPLYEEVAKAHGCLYLDGSDMLEVSEADGIHLSEKGHETLAKELADMIR